MKTFKVITIILFLVLVSSCVKETSTPKEYLNKNKVLEDAYLSDKNNLEKLLPVYIDSVNSKKKPVPKSKIISITIDTIFYSSDDKIVFLAILKRHNPYVESLKMKDNEEGVDYKGRCYIARKNTIRKDIRIVSKLKYSAGSKELDAYKRVKKRVRMIYLQEMGYTKGRYNINDNRFWESNVWK